MLGDHCGGSAAEEQRILVPQGKDAGRFDADDGNAATGVADERGDVMFGQLLGAAELAFGDRGAAAAFALVDADYLIAKCFSDSGGGDAGFGMEVVGERIDEEDDLAALRLGRLAICAPLVVGTGCELRQRPVAVDAESVQQRAGRGRAGDPVGERGGAGTPGCETVDAGEGTVPQRCAAGEAALGEHFVLDLGDVDAGGAFGLASFAFDAEIKRGMEAVAGDLVGRQPAVEDLAEQIGAAAGGVLLVARDLEGGAHRAVELAARALSVAHLGGAGEAALGLEAEQRQRIAVHRRGREAEVVAEGGRIDDLARIENAFRIED